MDYDVIIPVYWGTYPLIESHMPYIKKYLGGKKIILIGPASMREKLPAMEGVSFLDGNTLVQGMSKETVSDVIASICREQGVPFSDRAGWYFQQFIKMSYAFHCEEEYYVSWDMDTLPLKEIPFFSEKDGKPQFFERNEDHDAYFATLDTLCPGKITKCGQARSFVNQFMVFRTDIMKELVEMMGASAVQGDIWWEKVLRAVDPNDITHAGFSEFETYGNYTMQYHPQLYHITEIDQCRTGASFLSMRPEKKMLEWAARSYFCVTLEEWSMDAKWQKRSRRLYKLLSMKTLVNLSEQIDIFKRRVKKAMSLIRGNGRKKGG
ncbi:MAG: hypothetical protein NC409_03065 [Clostridium sp.]|nr:hypothetical protein [Clostridium sp.]